MRCHELKEYQGKASDRLVLSRSPNRRKTDPINAVATSGTGALSRHHFHGVRTCLSQLYERSVAVFPCIRWQPGKACQFIQHEGSSVNLPARAVRTRIHWSSLRREFRLVPDLGIDKLMIYKEAAARSLWRRRRFHFHNKAG